MTLKSIAVDLGISRGALKEWVDKLGSGTTTEVRTIPPSGRAESQAALKAEARKLETGRDILRQAAKYFAGETNW